MLLSVSEKGWGILNTGKPAKLKPQRSLITAISAGFMARGVFSVRGSPIDFPAESQRRSQRLGASYRNHPPPITH